jgi:hypothetical protein
MECIIALDAPQPHNIVTYEINALSIIKINLIKFIPSAVYNLPLTRYLDASTAI